MNRLFLAGLALAVFFVVVVAPVSAQTDRFVLTDGTKIVVSSEPLLRSDTYTLTLNGTLNMSTAQVVDDVLLISGIVSRVTTVAAPGGEFSGIIETNTAPRYKWRKKWSPFTVAGWDSFRVPSDSRGNFIVLLGQHIRIPHITLV